MDTHGVATMYSAADLERVSPGALWTGRAFNGLVVVLLLVDGAMKLVPLDMVVAASTELGIPVHLTRTLGVLTLICAILYAEDNHGNAQIKGLNTVTFTEANGKTTLTLVSRATALVPIGAQMIEGMQAGWTQSIDKLEELVARSR
jgi:hypothetical protein